MWERGEVATNKVLSSTSSVLTFLFPLLLTGSKFRAFSVELTTLQPEDWHTMVAVRSRDVHPSQAKRKCPSQALPDLSIHRMNNGGIWQHLALLTCGSKVLCSRLVTSGLLS